LENAASRKFIPIGNKEGLAGLEVHAILEDAVGQIWVGSVGGLFKLTPTANKKSYTIKRYVNKSDKPNSLGANFVRAIAEDTQGQIWIGTERGGVNLYQSATDDFKRYTTQNSQLNNDIIRNILVSKDGTMWVGTMNGLNVYNPFSKTF